MQLHAYAPTCPCAYCMPTCKGVVVSSTKSTHVVSCHAISFTTPGGQACVHPARPTGTHPTSMNIETAEERVALRVAPALTHLLPSFPRRPCVAFGPVGPSALVLPYLTRIYVCVAP